MPRPRQGARRRRRNTRHHQAFSERYRHATAGDAPREASATCTTCHTRGEHAWWQGSAHDSRNLSCVTCHSVHDPKSARAQLKTTSVTATCQTCHKQQAMKLQRIAHMPVREGKMECSTCHNPHGSTNVKQLRVGQWVNESCVSCHTEKRGPFLFEHAAGREAAVTCHDPHGANNDRMLVARTPMLCQRCHIGTRHPSTIYDATQFGNKSIRVIGRSCVSVPLQHPRVESPGGQHVPAVRLRAPMRTTLTLILVLFALTGLPKASAAQTPALIPAPIPAQYVTPSAGRFLGEIDFGGRLTSVEGDEARYPAVPRSPRRRPRSMACV